MRRVSIARQPWIRSPSFDLFWILSGLPLGLAFAGLVHFVPAVIIVFWCFLLVDTGHTLSPIALAWSHAGFRRHMVARSLKYILLPATILACSMLAGFGFSGQIHFNPDRFSFSTLADVAELRSPFMMVVVLYAAWNAFHFGKQAFGVMSIYRRKNGGGSRRIDLWYCCTVIWAAMGAALIPRVAHGLHDLTGWPARAHPFLEYVMWTYLGAAVILIAAMLTHEWFTTRSLPRAIFIAVDGAALALVFCVGLWGFAIIALNHWLVAIGLAAHVDANANQRSSWPFALTVMAAGFALFCLLFVDLYRLPTVGLTIAALHFTVISVSFRLGLGFVHFLYDRWLYQLHRPEVRATIGADLLAGASPRVIEPFPAIV